VDDAVLAALDKGHTREDFLRVTRRLRELGLTLHPTFVPFTPWTTLESYLDLLRVLRDEELIENVAPIQLGIRLLIPKGSRMLELEEIRSTVAPFDQESLVYPWKNRDKRVDALSDKVQAVAASADTMKWPRTKTFEAIWNAAHNAAGLAAKELKIQSSGKVPFLSEPGYCCAEPTKDQLVLLGATATKKEPRTTVTADSFV